MFAAKHVPLASCSTFYNLYWRRLWPGLLMILHIIKAPLGSSQLHHYNPFLGQPWKAPTKGNLHSEQNFGEYTWYYSLFGRKWPDVWSFTDSWAVANGLDGWSGTWKEDNWKFGERDIWGSMWIELSKWGKDMKIHMSHINYCQKVTSAQEKLSNQIDMTILWTVSLFPQPSISLPRGPMNKMALVAEMEVIHELDNMNFHSLSLTQLQQLMSARSANIRDQHWTHSIAPFPRVTCQWPGGR